VGGSADGAGGTATLTIHPGGSADISGTLRSWPGGTVNLYGGNISASAIQHDGNSGNFTITGGTLSAGSLSTPNGFTMFDGTLTVGSITAANTSIDGGKLRVTNFNGNLSNNGGIFAPGTSAGTTTINGNFSQFSPGVLQIELASASNFDKLVITGSLSPNGSVLDIELLNGYSPAAGQSFDILDWGSLDLFGGGFMLELPTLGGGRVWNTSQLNSHGVLRVDGAGMLPGDYNSNGIVDTADYIIWRKHVGTITTLSNDSIGGMIGQQHLDQWRANFGQTLGSALSPGFESAIPLVPEPASALLLLIGAWMSGCRLRRKSRNKKPPAWPRTFLRFNRPLKR
jgi:hypothetical protein